jgi:hypothetical protein
MEINNLEKQLPAELVLLIKTNKDAGEAVKGYIDNMVRHHSNPLYAEARKIFLTTQQEQIDKGAKKYPETFDPRSWTVDELVDHTMMELVDGIHYITGIQSKARDMRITVQLAIAAMNTEKPDTDFVLDCLKDILNQL